MWVSRGSVENKSSYQVYLSNFENIKRYTIWAKAEEEQPKDLLKKQPESQRLNGLLKKQFIRRGTAWWRLQKRQRQQRSSTMNTSKANSQKRSGPVTFSKTSNLKRNRGRGCQKRDGLMTSSKTVGRREASHKQTGKSGATWWPFKIQTSRRRPT